MLHAIAAMTTFMDSKWEDESFANETMNPHARTYATASQLTVAVAHAHSCNSFTVTLMQIIQKQKSPVAHNLHTACSPALAHAVVSESHVL